jgi:hypothetical protein
MQVFVLLFNAGSNSEGIHTLKLNLPDDDDGMPKDVVLAFEEEDDATRYALLLEAQDFPSATVEPIEEDELREFCQGSELVLQPVPSGSLAVPPETNMEQTDWQADEPPPSKESELDRIRKQLENLL